jgi:DNA-3-methyladenine glycosylase II
MRSAIAVIETVSDLERAIDALIAADARLADVHAAVGVPPLRRRGGGFEALLRIITDQQISLKAGASIWARTLERFDPLTAEAIAGASEEEIRSCGQSAAKARAMRAVAEAVLDGALDLAGLGELEDGEAMERLMRIKGIGPWTAEIYLLTCVGRADIWPAGDVALQTGVQLALGLEGRPGAREMVKLAEVWRPHRAVAARLLWAYYRKMTGRGD